jgi:hypothetical protein
MDGAIKIQVLREILQHLLNNPGEFQWNHYGSIHNNDPIELGLHRQWLREHGFTRIEEGKTYRTDKPLIELYQCLGQPQQEKQAPAKTQRLFADWRGEITPKKPEEPKPPKIAAQPKPKKVAEPKPKKIAQPKEAKKAVKPTPRPTQLSYLKSLSFDNLNLQQIADLVREKYQETYPLVAIQRTLDRMDGVTKSRLRGSAYTIYSHTANKFD